MTCYELLEVAATATQEEIRRQYKKLALKYHPDKNPGNPECEARFKDLGNANEILSDPIKRRAYDDWCKGGGSGEYQAFNEWYRLGGRSGGTGRRGHRDEPRGGGSGGDPYGSGDDDPYGSGDDDPYGSGDDDPYGSDDETIGSDDEGEDDGENLLNDLRAFYQEYTEVMGDRAESQMAAEAQRLHRESVYRESGGAAPPFTRACSACHPDAELLREVITHMVATPNVETYTDLFRCDASSLRTVSLPIRASRSRGARVYVYRHALLSDDADGEPLGYQSPESPINGRAPFFLEVQVCSPKGKWSRVPVISFHAPYGQSKDKKKKKPKVDTGEELPLLGRLYDEPLDEELLKMRAEAVRKLLDLGIPDFANGQPRPLKAFPDAVIAGDFNLDMLRERQSPWIHNAYQALRNSGFHEMVRNTATTFRSVDTCLPARGDQNARAELFWYSSAYDNIFVKRDQLTVCDVIVGPVPHVAGVVDVLDVMARHPDDFFGELTRARVGNHENYHPTEKYPAAQDPNDPAHGPRIRARNELARYDRCENDRQRAFFLYRKYISDHLPVFVDFFVAHTDEEGEEDLGVSGGPKRPPRPLIGLRNEGATCYVNAALQLMHAMGYGDRLGGQRQTYAAVTDDPDAQLAAHVLGVLDGLTTQAENGTYLALSNKLPDRQTALEQIWLDGNTRAIRQNLLNRALIERMSGTNEDANLVLRTMRSVLWTNPTAPSTSSFFREHFKEDDQVQPPELQSRYHFILRATIQYQRVRKIAKPKEPTTLGDDDKLIKYDSLDALELPIPDGDGLTLEDLVAAYQMKDVSKEKNTEHNCRIVVEDDHGEDVDEYYWCKPTFESWELVGDHPDEIVVGLKRFDYAQGGAKINRKVVCNDTATILGRKYKLRGFIYHTGKQLVDGHYITYVKRGEVWYELDDPKVTPNPSTLAERRDLAYVYWYVHEKDPQDDDGVDALTEQIKGMKITD